MPLRLRTADRYYRFSARLADRAVARALRERSLMGAAGVVAAHQATQANEAQAATSAMLAEQGERIPPAAALSALAFTTPLSSITAMLSDAEVEWQFARIVRGLVQDAGRAAQSVDMAARPSIVHVRHLNLPSCSRCAVLAGRVYRYSDGFKRHPGCDCVMIPTTVSSPDAAYDVADLARSGQVTGLSKADLRALEDGADFNQVVNVRSKKAGLTDAGEVLARRGRLTPAGIYRRADTREEAVDLLRQAGYFR